MHKSKYVVAAAALFGLAACGTHDPGNPEATATSRQAVTGPSVIPFAMTLPASVSFTNMTVGAAGSVLFGSRGVVGGLSASGTGPIEVQSDATAANVTSGGGVILDDRATVGGNVIAGTAVTKSQTATVHGTTTAGAGTATQTVAWSVTNPGGSQGPITLQNGAVGSPSPGVFDNVVVNAGSSLYLRSGTYFFNSFDLESGSQLFVDGRNGPVFLYFPSLIHFRGVESSVDGCAIEYRFSFADKFFVLHDSLPSQALPVAWSLSRMAEIAAHSASPRALPYASRSWV